MSRNKIYLTLIALLIIINIGYWSFFQSSPDNKEVVPFAAKNRITADDFLLPETAEQMDNSIARDIFFIQNKQQKSKVIKQVEIAETKSVPPPSTPKTTIQPKALISTPELIGIVYHQDQGSALIKYANKNHILAIGDEIDGRYKISAIERKTVKLYDKIAKQISTLQVSN